MYIYIRAMSEAQSEVYRKITDKTPLIVEHFVKLCMYPDSRDCNHWKQEIYSFLNTVPKLRNTKKYPKSSLIMKALTIYNDSIEGFIRRVTKKYGTDNVSMLSGTDIENRLRLYQTWLADVLSSEGFAEDDEIYAMLDKYTK